MMNKMYKIINLFILSLILLACFDHESISKSNCIEPPVKLAYPVRVTQTSFDQVIDVLPPYPWREISQLPQKGYITSMVIKKMDIWISTDEKILRYDINKMKWSEYDNVDGMPTIPQTLYVSKAGILWGFVPTIIRNPNTNSYFSRYNEITDSFEFIYDKEKLFMNFFQSANPKDIVEDPDGLLWFMEGGIKKNIVLFSFDPKSYSIKGYDLSPDSGFASLIYAPDNKIWLSKFENGDIIQFDPKTGKKSSYLGHVYNLPDEYPFEGQNALENFYLDHEGRLWIGDRGWYEFSGSNQPVFHRIIRSPVFISNNVHPENAYAWFRPDTVFESNDGMFWFESYGGMVSLDPEKAEWCKFTNASGPMVEDEEHNIWLAVDGKLYKNSSHK